MFGSSNTNSGFGSNFGAKPSGFGTSTPTNNNTSGGLFGNTNNNNKPSTGFNFGSPATSQPNNISTPTSGFGASNTNTNGGGLFGNKPATTGGGLFGNSATNNNTSSGGLFGNNNNNTAQTNAQGPGLFGNKPSTPASGGLFGNSSNTQQNGGGLFGNSSNNSNPSGGLFGNSSNTNNNTSSGGLFGNQPNNNSTSLFGNSSTSTAPKPGLFGNAANNTPQTTGGLFGSTNNNQAPTNSLFGSSNNNQLNQYANTPPTKQYNFKDLPKSITESAKKSNPALNDASRKRSLSNSSFSSSIPIAQGPRSTILERLSTRFSSLKSQARYDSEGLFSPKKDILHTALPAENSKEVQSSKVLIRPFGSSSYSSRASSRRRNLSTDYLKLKVDPSRSEARRIKIFGESGGAQKVRILGREEESTTNGDLNGSANAQVKDTHTHINEQTELIEETNETPGEAKLNTDTESKKNAATDAEYWCSPSIEELSALQLRQLSEISGFTIGRKGYGSISFEYPVDLTAFWSDLPGYLFGNVVKFNKNKTVEVYPNGKVPRGTGLNVPAIITLERCFPVSKRGKQASEDPVTKDLETRLFVRKLKDLKDMEYVTYDPFSGAWTFKVKHFSIWGLVNEDDDVVDVDAELENIQQKQSKLEEQSRAESTVNDQSLGQAQQLSSLKTRNLTENTFLFKKQKIDESFDYDTTDLMPGSFISGQTYDLIRAQQSQNDEEGVASHIPITISDDDESDLANDDIPADILRGDESLAQEDEEMDDYDSEILDEKQYEPVDVDQDDFKNLEVDPKLAVDDDWTKQLNLSARFDSAFAKDSLKQTTLYDAPFSKGLTPGELDNLIFGDFSKVLKSQKKIKKELRLDNYNFTHFTNEAKLILKSNETASHAKEHSLDDFFGITNKNIFKTIYKKHLNLAHITQRSNGYPKVDKNQDLTFDFILDSFKGDFKNEELPIWSLASILFDTKILLTPELSSLNDVEVVNRVVEVKRREKLIGWFKNEIEKEVKTAAQQTEDFSEQIFLLLVAFEVSNAARLAINTSNPYLSVLISLLGSNDPSVKISATKQIEEWKKNAVLQTIPKGILKIYYLLKGDVLATDPIVKLSEGLSWKARLGLSLYYGDSNQSIATLLSNFVATNPADIPYEDETFYNILKLFVHKHNDQYNIGHIISALKLSKNLDVRFQWYIYEVLVRSTEQLNFKRSEEFGDQLTLLFAEQLQAAELWEEALFVLAHLHNDHAAEYYTTQLLTTKIEAFNRDDTLLDRLRDGLHIPETLLFEANALYYRYTGDYWKEAAFLLDAKKYEEAHRTIIGKVAPAAVINNGSKLNKLDKLIKRFPKQNYISDWSTGLEIYQNYLALINGNTQKSLKFLADNLPSMKQSSFKVKVAARIIAKRVADTILENAGTGSSGVEVDKILKLPLGEGESQYYAAPLTLQYVKQQFLEGA